MKCDGSFNKVVLDRDYTLEITERVGMNVVITKNNKRETIDGYCLGDLPLQEGLKKAKERNKLK